MTCAAFSLERWRSWLVQLTWCASRSGAGAAAAFMCEAGESDGETRGRRFGGVHFSFAFLDSHRVMMSGTAAASARCEFCGPGVHSAHGSFGRFPYPWL